MHVATILQNKGATVHTLPATVTLAEAVTLLNVHNIGAVVITDAGGRVSGILSERDIVRQLAHSPTGALAFMVGETMTRSVETCEPLTPVAAVMERMTRLRIRHMPVVDGLELVGIISIGDVVKLKLEEAEHEAEAMREYISN